ncbi:hypothetical protein LTR60_000718 [Cryomyces antarcticus]|nr:hypothetical protein LTR60_000718 [Cryomyces antarcticus]
MASNTENTAVPGHALQIAAATQGLQQDAGTIFINGQSFISAQEAEDYLRTTPDDSKVDVALAIQGAYESRKAIYEDNLASLWTIMEDFSSRQSAD